MLKSTFSIKSRALAFCDCPEVHDKYKQCIQPSAFRQSMIPTLVENDKCKYCESYVFWEPGYVPFCSCPEVLLLNRGEDLDYYKRPPTKIKYETVGTKKRKIKKRHVITYKLKKEQDLPPPWMREKEPTETFKSRTNDCKYCGDIVQWRRQK